jgi:hypothetical protein
MAFHGFKRLKIGLHRVILIPVTHPTLGSIIHVTIPTLGLRVNIGLYGCHREIERLYPALAPSIKFQ